jgi:hypothetical protein
MRLTAQEAKEAVGIDPIKQLFTGCIQTDPCLLERAPSGEFTCGTHHTLFLPALLRGSAFWARVLEGLTLALLVSGPWDTANVGGEEVDVDWLFEEPQPEESAATSLSPYLPGAPHRAPSSQLAHQ